MKYITTKEFNTKPLSNKIKLPISVGTEVFLDDNDNLTNR